MNDYKQMEAEEAGDRERLNEETCRRITARWNRLHIKTQWRLIQEYRRHYPDTTARPQWVRFLAEELL